MNKSSLAKFLMSNANKPNYFSYSYTSQYINQNGKENKKELYEMQTPDCHYIARTNPEEEQTYDIKMKKIDKEGKVDIEKKKLTQDEFQDDFDKRWREFDLDHQFNSKFNEPEKPMLQQDNKETSNKKEEVKEQICQEKVQNAQNNMKAETENQKQNLEKENKSSSQALKKMNKSKELDMFSSFEDFDQEFREFERRMDRMRRSMFRNFMHFDI